MFPPPPWGLQAKGLLRIVYLGWLLARLFLMYFVKLKFSFMWLLFICNQKNRVNTWIYLIKGSDSEPFILNLCSELELKPVGKLTLTVARANDLKNMELVGKSDPYVVLHIRPLFKVKTKVIDNNLNPVWDQTFELIAEDKETQCLIFEVFLFTLCLSSDLCGLSCISVCYLLYRTLLYPCNFQVMWCQSLLLKYVSMLSSKFSKDVSWSPLYKVVLQAVLKKHNQRSVSLFLGISKENFT